MEKKKNNYIYTWLYGLIIVAFFSKYIQLIYVLLLIAIFIKSNKGKIKISNVVIPFILYFFVHLLSIIVNLADSSDWSRVLAAINTAFIWLAGSIIFSYISTESIDMNKIRKIFSFYFLIFAILALMMVLCEIIGINSFNIGSRSLFTTDWVYGEQTIRFMGFMEYSNLIPLVSILCIPFVVDEISKVKNSIIKIIMFILILLPTYLTNSRIGIILLFIFFIVIVPRLIVKRKKYLKIIYLIIFLVISTIILINFNFFSEKFENLINSREGSTSMRLEIYTSSIEKVISKNIFIGCGIKEIINGYPLGSHSTYIGMFYKAGILGIVLGVWGLTNIYKKLRKSFKLLPKYYFISFMFMIIMMAVEDLDGANWLITLFFITYGIILGINTEKR